MPLMLARTIGRFVTSALLLGADGRTAADAFAQTSGALVPRVAGGPQATTHALLIGVTTYPSLGSPYQLKGPANDVALMRDTLVSPPFEVDPARITELVDPSTRLGAQRPAPPTRANIEREFKRLAATVRRGDQVVVLFAGHGSQQPDTGPARDEEDGLDEILLPSDIARWDGRVGRVEGAITDDELGAWLSAIRRQGAFVWVIVDACQSASSTRGSREVQRLVPPDVLGIPSYAAQTTHARGAGSELATLGLDETSGDLAALYAAQTTEPTPEKALPQGGVGGRMHGLFTFTLVKMLRQASGRLTYRDLAERVVQDYRALGRIGPTPAFEGGGLDRTVLGTAIFTRRSRPLIGGTRDGRTTLRAGAVHGLTRGSILAVYPPGAVDSSGSLIGYVKATEVGPTTAVIVPTVHDGRQAPPVDALQPNSWCEIVFHDFGFDTLKVAYEAEPGAPGSVDRALRDSLAQLARLSRGMVSGDSTIAQADWIVRLRTSGDVALGPASGWRVDPALVPEEDQQAPFSINDPGPDLERQLADALVAVARVRNLVQLASQTPVGGDVSVDVEALRYRPETPHGRPIVADGGFRRVRVGEQIAFRIRNTGALAADVTLLYIDADYRIGVVFPLPDQDATAQLAPGAETTTVRMEVTPPTGWEHVIVVTTARTAIRHDLRVLEQPPLQRARTRAMAVAEQVRSLPESPLGNLLRMASHLDGGTRGQPVAHIRDYAIRMLTWRTESESGRTEGGAPP